MNSTLLLTAVFTLGVVLGTGVAFWRMKRAVNASPWDTPRTPYIDALRYACELLAYELAGSSSPACTATSAYAPVEYAPVAALQKFTIWSGVSLFENGKLVLPDGTRVPYWDAVGIAAESLRCACGALHDAANLLAQFGEALPNERLREYRDRNRDALVRIHEALGAVEVDAIMDACRRELSCSVALQGDRR